MESSLELREHRAVESNARRQSQMRRVLSVANDEETILLEAGHLHFERGMTPESCPTENFPGSCPSCLSNLGAKETRLVDPRSGPAAWQDTLTENCLPEHSTLIQSHVIDKYNSVIGSAGGWRLCCGRAPQS